MLPISDDAGPGFQLKKHKNSELVRKSSFNSLAFNSVFLPHHSRIWVILSILLVQLLLLCSLRFLPLPHRRSSYSPPLAAASLPPPPTSVLGHEDECSSGRIFVYDLPKFFNQEILDNCDDLDPWNSRCDALSNRGFGRKAESLAGIVPESVAPAWYWTDQFALEVIFHNRILHHKCRVFEAESATAFYIPSYIGLAVGKYLWFNASANDRDHHCNMMLRWVQDLPYYKKSNGWDHFISIGRITWDFRRLKDAGWGSNCIFMPAMRNITRFLIERNPWDYFEIGVPYPTGFHPSSLADIAEWQSFVRNKRRSNLFSFAGGTRGAIKGDFRGLLLNHCRNMSGFCRVVDCSGTRCLNGTSAILEAFLDSDFCLQPRGDSFTRRSIFDCMVAGSIPVFFWKRTAYYQYDWFLPSEPTSYSVFLDRNGVKNGSISVKSVLQGFSEEEKTKMREKLIEFIPRFLYSKPEKGIENLKDAFDVAIEGVLRRFKYQQDPGFKKWK